MTRKITIGSGAMFDGIANRYDLLNRLTSLGMDRRWRRMLVEGLSPRDGALILDVAAGTGDVSLAIVRNSGARVVALDASKQMLRGAAVKSRACDVGHRVTLLAGNAEELGLQSGLFDGVTIAFGIRNFSNRARALAEIRRVLKPGGKVVILELAMPRSGILAPAVRWYIRTVIPVLGRVLSRGDAYAYLGRSMERFPSPEAFCEELEAGGFGRVTQTSFMFGACYLFVANRCN